MSETSLQTTGLQTTGLQTTGKPTAGETRFYDSSQPGLTPGDYQITVTQTLSEPNNLTPLLAQSVTQEFVVRGPQFTLDPSEVHAMFPDDNTNGNFASVLPNVVLVNPTLPWERTITSDSSVPWLALLVFDEGEIEIFPESNSPLIASTVAAFLAPESEVVKPSVGAPPAELASSTMNSIRIPVKVFQQITPRLQELSTLAHVREVDPSNQAIRGTGRDGWFSVVLANRFPASSNSNGTGSVNYVHLVSLEGLANYLVDEPEWPTGVKAVQVASLASWRFVSTVPQGDTFAGLAANLVQSSGDGQSLCLRIPVDSADAQSAAGARLLDGYTALSCHTVPGPHTFAWYRGPFTPAPAQPLPDTGDFIRHPTQVSIYDEATAVFDLSYSAAWSIGRLAALADPIFIDSLRRLRGALTELAGRLQQRSAMPHLSSITDLEKLASEGLTRQQFFASVREGLASKLSERFAAPLAAGTQAYSAAQVNPYEAARDALANPDVRAFLANRAQRDLGPLADWLAKLALLHHIPFNHLVPDQRMLPVESVRFFFVDASWVRMLVEAAMYVGVHGGRSRAIQDIISGPLWDLAKKKIPQVRKKLLHIIDESPTGMMPASGMLLRSELVSGWPGLEVTGTLKGQAVQALRIDRVAPNILLALWSDIPDTVTITQPQQGLSFGTQESGLIGLRSLSPSTLAQPLNRTFPTDADSLSPFMRTTTEKTGGRVLNLAPPSKQQVQSEAPVIPQSWLEKAQSLEAAVGRALSSAESGLSLSQLKQMALQRLGRPGTSAAGPRYLIPELSHALQQSPDIGAASFAIQMIQTPRQIQFQPPATPAYEPV
jgi:hypothetical protein